MAPLFQYDWSSRAKGRETVRFTLEALKKEDGEFTRPDLGEFLVTSSFFWPSLRKPRGGGHHWRVRAGGGRRGRRRGRRRWGSRR